MIGCFIIVFLFVSNNHSCGFVTLTQSLPFLCGQCGLLDPTNKTFICAVMGLMSSRASAGNYRLAPPAFDMPSDLLCETSHL